MSLSNNSCTFLKGKLINNFVDNYVVVDIETSGFSSTNDKIIEIGAIKVVNNQVVDTFQTLVNPTVTISGKITCLTGITNEMLKSAPSLDIVLTKFLDFVEDYILVGHNIANFDINFLCNNISSVLKLEFKNNFIDTLKISQSLYDFESYKLESLKNKFSIGENVEHRALSDCFDTLKCYQYMQLHYEGDTIELSNCDNIKTNNKNKHNERIRNVAYTEETQSLQLLQGLLMGITCDNILTLDEVHSLKQWLDNNKHLSGNYPFDRTCFAIEKALEDNILEECELKELLEIFKNIINPAKQSSAVSDCLSLENAIVCLTGEFESCSRFEMEKLVESNGAIVKNTVVKNTDYLIVGGQGSCNWKCGNYGAKIKKALELQDKGSYITIICEADFNNLIKKNDLSSNKELETDFEYVKDDDVDVACDENYINNLQNDIIKQLLNACKSCTIRNNILEEYIQLYIRMKKDNPNKISSYSIKLDKNSIMLISNKCKFIRISRTMKEYLNVPNDFVIKEIKSQPQQTTLYFNSISDNILSFIFDCTQYAIDNFEPSNHFGCCGKYIECSDNNKCLHDDNLYAKGCGYRKNLEQGKIFYGANKNLI